MFCILLTTQDKMYAMILQVPLVLKFYLIKTRSNIKNYPGSKEWKQEKYNHILGSGFQVVCGKWH